MRRTRKWGFVAQEAIRLAELGLSPLEIATRLGVNKSTVTRWQASGKLPIRSDATRATLEVKPSQSPAEWAIAVRAEYDLDATDNQLVNIAQAALELSMDPDARPNVRMTASGRFQAIVRQLALALRGSQAASAPAPGASEPPKKPVRPAVQRSTRDPRLLMMPATVVQ